MSLSSTSFFTIPGARVVLGFGAEGLMRLLQRDSPHLATHALAILLRRSPCNSSISEFVRLLKAGRALEDNFHAIVSDAHFDATLDAHRPKFRCEGASIAGNDFRAAVRKYRARHTLFHAPAELRFYGSVAD